MPPEGFDHCIECHLPKVFYMAVLAITGFHSHKGRRTLFVQIIENPCCHYDYWLNWRIRLRLFMEFAQDATWRFWPLHRMSTTKGVLHGSVYQHCFSLTCSSKKDLVCANYWKSMLSLWLLITLKDKVIKPMYSIHICYNSYIIIRRLDSLSCLRLLMLLLPMLSILIIVVVNLVIDFLLL
jgi:hypothetical protein